MELISPVTAEMCKSYIGKPVCAILHDGSYYVGTLSGVTEKGLEFNQAYSEAKTLSTQASKAKKQLHALNSKSKAKTSAAVSPYGFGPEAFVLDFALIALLFLLPFVFI